MMGGNHPVKQTRKDFFEKGEKCAVRRKKEEKGDQKIGGESQIPVYKSRRSIFISSARQDDVSQLRPSVSTSLSPLVSKYALLLFFPFPSFSS